MYSKFLLWIKSFWTGRMRVTKFNDFSSAAFINCLIVQGSGLGPILFIMFAFDVIYLWIC